MALGLGLVLTLVGFAVVQAATARALIDAEPGRPVSPLLATAIAAGLRGARLTDGLVDPTVGRAMRLIGYDRDFDRLADDAGLPGLRFEAIPG